MTAELLSWDIEASYIDARGAPKPLGPAAHRTLARSLACDPQNAASDQRVAVLRLLDPPQIGVPDGAGTLSWRLFAQSKEVASGETSDRTITLPNDMQIGSYRLAIDAEDGVQRKELILVAPDAAYQPPFLRDGDRAWLLMVQLYAVRSAHNWGHGDFGDLARLLEIAAGAGAAGIGLNPLHNLAPGQASGYSPSSRIFLNPLYIDIEAIDEFPGTAACGLTDEVERLRAADVLDYGAIFAAKYAGLRAAYEAFKRRAANERRNSFKAFREQRGASLERFAIFETLRERFGLPWQTWPPEWRNVTHALERNRAGELGDIEFPAFIQWIANDQLGACAAKGRLLGLPIGLYLDVAVGIDAGGADVWAAPLMLCRNLSIGAPPDVYNVAGQNWGLASFHPQALIDSDFALYRELLRSAMRYAGAIRIDHALGLNRLYLIPEGESAAQGGYVRLPFAAMLAATAQESMARHCLVIGEDLGTIPEGVCAALNQWGIWSYRVGLFEREHDGTFRQPSRYPEKAIVTFNTHDLPTFAGWKSSHDLKVRAALGQDPGETEDDRQAARHAMRATLAEQGLGPQLTLIDVLRYLARTRSQLLAVSLEDILGLLDQSNVPGTITEHPNWRRRLPCDINALTDHETLCSIAKVMAAEGRACAKVAGALTSDGILPT